MRQEPAGQAAAAAQMEEQQRRGRLSTLAISYVENAGGKGWGRREAGKKSAWWPMATDD